MVRIRLQISGRVQGVWYRASTQREAMRLGLLGWVRNLENGSVEAEIQGPAEQAEALVTWCHIGPPKAQVETVERISIPCEDGETRFTVRR